MDDETLTDDVADVRQTFPERFDRVEPSTTGRWTRREVTDVPDFSLRVRVERREGEPEGKGDGEPKEYAVQDAVTPWVCEARDDRQEPFGKS